MRMFCTISFHFFPSLLFPSINFPLFSLLSLSFLPLASFPLLLPPPPPHPGNGYHALIDQDKFMSETWDHWFVGGDNSGDVMVWRNMVEMRSWVKEEMGDVHLVSSCLDTCCKIFHAKNLHSCLKAYICTGGFIADAWIEKGDSSYILCFLAIEFYYACQDSSFFFQKMGCS